MPDGSVQLEVFPTCLHLQRVDAARNMRRFYRMTIQGVEESVYTLQIFTNEGVMIKRAIIKR